MTRLFAALAIATVFCFAQESKAAVSLNFKKFDLDGQQLLDAKPEFKPMCIDLSLQKKVDLLKRTAIAGVDLDNCFDRVNPVQRNNMFQDIRPNRFSTSNIG